MKQPHDTQVGWQVLVRNVDNLTALVADKGYDWEALRTRLRAERITPLIPQRGPGFRGWERNLLIHDRRITSLQMLSPCFSDCGSDIVRRCWRERGSVNSANLS
ncbi:transposase [Halorubrum sp. Atlit-26R]|uniref:transposase n=1 Tax=Halorubrum sp. Atlit-26R TaxID=2282128 RepID=UPI0018F42DAE